MKKRWGAVRHEVYKVFADTEGDSRLPDKFEAARLEEKLHDFIISLSRKDASSQSAKTTEITTSSTNDEDEVESSGKFAETGEQGFETWQPDSDWAPAIEGTSSRKKESPIGTADKLGPTLLGPNNLLPPNPLDGNMSVNTLASGNASTPTAKGAALQSYKVANLPFSSERDRDIWQTFLDYNDPNLLPTTELPALHAPRGVAASLRKKYGISHGSLALHLQRIWRSYQQSRAGQQNGDVTSAELPGRHADSTEGNRIDTPPINEPFTPDLEVDRQIWKFYVQYNDPDAPVSARTLSFHAPHGTLVPLREGLRLTKSQLYKRLTKIWHKYLQHKASSHSCQTSSSRTNHPHASDARVAAQSEVTPVPSAPPAPPNSLVSAPVPAPALTTPALPTSSLRTADHFTDKENESLWHAFMQQRHFRPLPPRRVDNIVSPNLISVAFGIEQAAQLGCSYTELRRHLEGMIFAHQMPKTTLTAAEENYVWSTFQEHKQLDTVLRAEAVQTLAKKFQCTPTLVEERLKSLTALRCVTPDGADLAVPEPVPRIPSVPTPAVGERAHVPTPHSATTHVIPPPPVIPRVPRDQSNGPQSAEELAARLDTATATDNPAPPRYGTRSRVPSESRSLQEVNELIWSAYSPYDGADVRVADLPRNFLPNLANQIGLPSSVVKERLQGLIRAHYPPPPPFSFSFVSEVTHSSAAAVDAKEKSKGGEVKKRRKRRTKEEMQHAKEAKLPKLVGSHFQSVSAAGQAAPTTTSYTTLTGALGVLVQAAAAFPEGRGDQKEHDFLGGDENEGGEESGNQEDGEKDAMSLLTIPSDDSDHDDQDTKLLSVQSPRFTYTPPTRSTLACVSTSTIAQHRAMSTNGRSTDNITQTSRVSGPSVPSLSLSSVVESSASSEVSSVSSDVSLPLPFTPQEDAYLWGIVSPAFMQKQPLDALYQLVQNKFNRTRKEVSNRLAELVQHRHHPGQK